jgi:prepilin signal peptidase PulO-like enzyme (type II secretory pathway)
VTRTGLVLGHALAYLVALFLLPQDGMARWIAAAVLGPILTWISVVDFERFEIPDPASLALFLGGVVGLWTVPGAEILDRSVGAVVWPVLIWVVAKGYARLRGRIGLGFGDVKLMAGIGLWVGFGGGVLVLLAASLSGVLLLTCLAAVRRTPLDRIGGSAVAFGPFLCLSTWVVWLAGGT